VCGLGGDFARLRFSLGAGEGVKWQPLESERRRPRWVETSKPYREEDLMKKLLTIAILAAAAVAVPLVVAQNAGQPAPQQGDQADKAQAEADAKAKRRAQANAEMKAQGQPAPQKEEEEEARKKR